MEEKLVLAVSVYPELYGTEKQKRQIVGADCLNTEC